MDAGAVAEAAACWQQRLPRHPKTSPAAEKTGDPSAFSNKTASKAAHTSKQAHVEHRRGLDFSSGAAARRLSSSPSSLSTHVLTTARCTLCWHASIPCRWRHWATVRQSRAGRSDSLLGWLRQAGPTRGQQTSAKGGHSKPHIACKLSKSSLHYFCNINNCCTCCHLQEVAQYAQSQT